MASELINDHFNRVQMSCEDNAKLIYLLFQKYKDIPGDAFNILVAEDGEKIDLNDRVYTPQGINEQNENNLGIPAFLQLKFISRELWNNILLFFHDVMPNGDNPKRQLCNDDLKKYWENLCIFMTRRNRQSI